MKGRRFRPLRGCGAGGVNNVIRCPRQAGEQVVVYAGGEKPGAGSGQNAAQKHM